METGRKQTASETCREAFEEEALLDEALKESFPASDPVAITISEKPQPDENGRSDS